MKLNMNKRKSFKILLIIGTVSLAVIVIFIIIKGFFAYSKEALDFS